MTTKKGRSKELVQIRDCKLIKRYFDLMEVKRLRLDDVLQILSRDEFFISERTVWLIIKKNIDKIDILINEQKRTETIKIKYINQ